MPKNGHTPKKQDAKQASLTIAVLSVFGLTTCFVVGAQQDVHIPIFLYAIFGGGILGTDNILKILKSIFRIDR